MAGAPSIKCTFLEASWDTPKAPKNKQAKPGSALPGCSAPQAPTVWSGAGHSPLSAGTGQPGTSQHSGQTSQGCWEQGWDFLVFNLGIQREGGWLMD